MTLAETLRQKLAEWRPPTTPTVLRVEGPDGYKAVLTAERVESLGCRLNELTLKGPAFAAGELRGRAEQVADRATGLLEPLKFLEADDDRGRALLRSETPGQVGEGRFYYEAWLGTDGTFTLRRFQAPATAQSRRQQVPFTLTHEALSKLVGDLTA
jgi:hypothetical protein